MGRRCLCLSWVRNNYQVLVVVSVFEPQVVPDLRVGSELLIVSIFETAACTVCTSGALVPELGSKLLQYISCFSS
jgi:hypothetical protein